MLDILPVEFDDPRDVDDAVYELKGKELLGERWAILIEDLLHFCCLLTFDSSPTFVKVGDVIKSDQPSLLHY